MTKEEAKKILTEYVKACHEDDMFTLEQFTYEEVIEAMGIGAEAISVLPVSSDLGEAAKNYAMRDKWTYEHFGDAVMKAVFFGAKWQAEQDKETIELAEDHAYLAGAVNEREKMMKEAVKCETVCIKDRLLAVLPMNEFRWTVGDKVRVIIVKED